MSKDYIEIELTKGKVALIDKEDKDKVLKWYGKKPTTWYASVMNAYGDNPRYNEISYVYAEKRLTPKQQNYINENYPGILKPKKNGGTTKNLLLHRFVMEAPHDMFVDHINGNTLDCRKENLRLCTFQQNCQNRKKRSDSRHKYIGISKRHSDWNLKKPWRGCVKHLGKNYYTECFKTEYEAAKARDELAKKMRGEFARLNFPDE